MTPAVPNPLFDFFTNQKKPAAINSTKMQKLVIFGKLFCNFAACKKIKCLEAEIGESAHGHVLLLSRYFTLGGVYKPRAQMTTTLNSNYLLCKSVYLLIGEGGQNCPKFCPRGLYTAPYIGTCWWNSKPRLVGCECELSKLYLWNTRNRSEFTTKLFKIGQIFHIS